MDFGLIIKEALANKYSDIHFIPYESFIKVYYRKEDKLMFVDDVEKAEFRVFLQKVKASSEMNISEKRLPQDGIYKVYGEAIRVSTLKTIQGESLTLRIFNRDIKVIENLGIKDVEVKKILDHIYYKSGITLIAGETGMGKSTTLYAIMIKLVEKNFKVISIEDPVERELSGVSQCQINIKAGLDYDKAIFASLRQDPDYICIGEIRNKETAKALIRASLTGHKVISTIHSFGYKNTIERLKDFDIEETYSKAALGLVISQVLKEKDNKKGAEVLLDYK